MKRSYQIGRLGFTISGNDKVLPYLYEEFSPVELDGIEASHLDFVFLENKGVNLDGEFSITTPMRVEEQCYQVNHQCFSYTVNLGSPAKILISSDPLSLKHRILPSFLRRSYDWNFLNKEENMAKNFVYSIFDYLSQVVNLPLNQTYIHASSFAKEDYGVVVAARGGTGKTTSMLKFVIDDGWKYISDDLVGIDSQGLLWRTPKKLQVYAYNLQGEPAIRHRLLHHRSLIDKTSWNLHKSLKGKNKVRRRVSAEKLFGIDSVAKSAKLKKAFFIERANVNEFYYRVLDKKDFSQRLASMLLEEVNPFFQFSIALHANGHRHILPSVVVFLKMVESILESALSYSENILVQVPLNASPTDLHQFLSSLL